jgi:UDP-N-acetylglucosamine 2-epimerase (non-hydrolysing)
MIDALVAALPTARALRAAERRGLTAGSYALVTLHRPSNVDHPQGLVELVGALDTIAGHLPVVFPVHPRARHRLEEQGLAARLARVHLLEPLPYLEMLSLVDSARLVITDSGGLQEETTFLGVPCLTVRANTERPITITQGTNRLVADARALVAAVLNGARRQRPGAAGAPGAPRAIERWDGHAAERIAAVLCANEQFGW